jgi:TIR domain
MAHDIFISYAMADKATADAACAALEKEGIRCWIAPRDVLPGIDYAEAIIEAIERSKGMLLIFSSQANRSNQVKREVERAVHHGIAIIPFRIEAVEPARSLEYYISSPHWLEAMTPPMEQHLIQLTSTVKLLLNRSVRAETQAQGFRQSFTQHPPDGPDQTPLPSATRPARSRVLWYVLAGTAAVLLGLCVLAVAAALWIVNSFSPRPHPTPTPIVQVSPTPAPTGSIFISQNTPTPAPTTIPTSTPIASSTPTPVYSPVVEQTPTGSPGSQKPILGQVLFADDFQTLLPGWGTPNNHWEVKNGRFVLHPSLNQFYFQYSGRGPFTDVSIEVDVVLAKGSDLTRPGGIVFWCRDTQNFYIFAINMQGYYNVMRRYQNRWITILASTHTDALNQGVGETNHLQLVTRGTSADLFANDQPLQTVSSENPDAGGQVGLYGESAQHELMVWEFMHLKISSLR